MIYNETDLPGCYLIEPEPIEDERGFFARTFDADEFSERDITFTVAQASMSYNRVEGTLRGLHYQVSPDEEAKVVHCTRGSLFDVQLDLRVGLHTYGTWQSCFLSHENRRAIYIPPGIAHGYLTLSSHTELFYLMSTGHAPESSSGVRWDDPTLRITWPRPPRVLSARDASLPYLSPPQ